MLNKVSLACLLVCVVIMLNTVNVASGRDLLLTTATKMQLISGTDGFVSDFVLAGSGATAGLTLEQPAPDALGRLVFGDGRRLKTGAPVALSTVLEVGVTAGAETDGTDAGFSPGPDSAAQFGTLRGAVSDSGGYIYIVDVQLNIIWVRTPPASGTGEGTWSVLAGKAGCPGSTDGVGESALFETPGAIALVETPTGEVVIYVMDDNSRTLRKIDVSKTGAAPVGSVSTSVPASVGWAHADDITVTPERDALFIASGSFIYRMGMDPTTGAVNAAAPAVVAGDGSDDLGVDGPATSVGIFTLTLAANGNGLVYFV